MATASRPALLWILTIVLVAAAVVYQRRTGPTYPYRTTITVAQNERVPARLVRSSETSRDAEVVVPSPGGAVSGTLFWRRYPTRDEWRALPMAQRTADGGITELVGQLPRQAAAGKLEYRLELVSPGGAQRVPAAPNAEGEDLVMRFKDPVPAVVLMPHVVMMFLALLLGLRAGLGALFGTDGWQRYVGITAVCMTVGGMILGPIVQKYVFGAYWTGFPFGSDHRQQDARAVDQLAAHVAGDRHRAGVADALAPTARDRLDGDHAERVPDSTLAARQRTRLREARSTAAARDRSPQGDRHL